MTRERAKQVLELIQAYADGKTIQIKTLRDGWEDLDSPGFDNTDLSIYRIKPEPQLRAWKVEEIPMGALVKPKAHHGWRDTIIYVSSTGHIAGKDISANPDFALDNWLHSIDGGKTFKPCGVEL